VSLVSRAGVRRGAPRTMPLAFTSSGGTMDTYRLVYDAIIAAYDAEADASDAVLLAATHSPSPGPGIVLRATGRQVAPIVAGQVQAAVNAIKTISVPTPGGPVPIPYPNLGGFPGLPGLSGLPGFPGLPSFPGFPGFPGFPNLAGLPGLPGLPTLPGIDP